MQYKVKVEKRAAKILEKINDPDYGRIKATILGLGIEPRPVGYKKLKNRKGFRVRSGVYRVVYDIEDDILMVKVITIGHRKDVYK